VGHVVRMGEMRDAYRVLVWKSDISLGGRIILQLFLKKQISRMQPWIYVPQDWNT